MSKKKYKIAIYGSALDLEYAKENIIYELIEEISKIKPILITGAGAGIPYMVASSLAKKGVEVWAYMETTNLEEQKKTYPANDQSFYSRLFFIPQEFEYKDKPLVCKKYRNVISTANCDAGIIISGRWGTLNEFTNLFDMGKVIGVLTGTGGVADELSRLVTLIKKKGDARVFFDSSPRNLIKKVYDELKLRDK